MSSQQTRQKLDRAMIACQNCRQRKVRCKGKRLQSTSSTRNTDLPDKALVEILVGTVSGCTNSVYILQPREGRGKSETRTELHIRPEARIWQLSEQTEIRVRIYLEIPIEVLHIRPWTASTLLHQQPHHLTLQNHEVKPRREFHSSSQNCNIHTGAQQLDSWTWIKMDQSILPLRVQHLQPDFEGQCRRPT